MPLLILIGLRAFGVSHLGKLILAWGIFLAVRLLFEKRQRPITFFWIFFTLYCVSAWIAATQFEQRYPPFPATAVITTGTWISLEVLTLAFVALRLVTVFLPFRPWWRTHMAEAGEMAKKMSVGRLAVAALPLVVIAGIDWHRLFGIGLGNVFAGERREFAESLLSTGNHNVWVFAVAATLALALHAIASGLRSRSALFAYGVLVFYWTPSILIGSRHQLFAAGISVAVVALTASLLSRRAILRLKIGIVTLFAAVFLLPWVETGKLNQSTIEYVYPQYILFSSMSLNLPLHANYLHGAAFMLPSKLRPYKVELPGTQFKELGITTVGIADHPIGEAFINSPDHVVPFAVGATLIALMLVVLLTRLSPAFLMVGIGQLATWGRSDFWVFVFFVVYGGAILWLLLPSLRQTRLEAGH